MAAQVTSRLQAAANVGDNFFILRQVAGFATGTVVTIDQEAVTVAGTYVPPLDTTLAQYGNNVHVPITTTFLNKHVEGAPCSWSDPNASAAQAD